MAPDDPEAAFDPYLRADDVSFATRDATLLRAVAETGSLNAAATRLGRSYARAHERVATLEAAFGPLLDRRRGGADGGGSDLTDRARALLARFDRLRAAFDGTAAAEESVLAGRVLAHEGALATVETAAGELRALAPPSATAVDVVVRADAVTLHDPAATPPPDATSARNRLVGDVTAVAFGAAVVRVAIDVGPTTLVAFVTAESVDRLDLSPGRPVVATFKATATRAVPASPDEPDHS